jgi:hypothetical protein
LPKNAAKRQLDDDGKANIKRTDKKVRTQNSITNEAKQLRYKSKKLRTRLKKARS